MSRRLDNYVFREMLSPVALGFLVSTAILLIRFFFESAEAIIQRNVATELVLRLLLLNLPHIVVITIPMSLLFGILVAIGRLGADSELTAMRASGMSLFRLYRPILALSLLLALANTWLMVHVLPWGNRNQEELMQQIFAEGTGFQIQPRVFSEVGDDRVAYIFDHPPGEERFRGVFLADRLPIGDFDFTVADSGSIELRADGSAADVVLYDALDQTVNLNSPQAARVTHDETLTLRSDLDPRTIGGTSVSVRSLDLEQLRAWRDDPQREPMQRRLATIEMHKKFSIPAACLVFGVIALPLGFNRRTGSRSSAFTQSLFVILVYHLLQNTGEDIAATGRFSPWMAMWLPNLFFLALGGFLLIRKNRDKSVLLHEFGDRLRSLLRSRRGQPAAEASQPSAGAELESLSPARLSFRSESARAPLRIRVEQMAWRFPSRFDRYILRLFAQVYLFVLAAAMLLFVIFDFTGLVDDVLENNIGWGLLARHYGYYAVEIVYEVAPIAVLLTTLISFAILSHGSEVIAAKALGFSLYRLALPVAVAGALLGGLSFFLDLTVLPTATSKRSELRAIIKGREGQVNQLRQVQQQWFYSQRADGTGYIFNYLHFNPQRPQLQRLQVFRFDPDHRLTGHLYANDVQWTDGGWVMRDGWLRRFDGRRMLDFELLEGPGRLDLDQEPEFFSNEIKASEHMNLFELRDYVRNLKISGQRVPDLEVELQNKVAMPTVCLVMVFVGLPFAFRLGRRGTLYGIGLSILVGIVFYALLAFFTTLGEVAALPPVVAAWSPGLLFSFLSLYMFLGVES